MGRHLKFSRHNILHHIGKPLTCSSPKIVATQQRRCNISDGNLLIWIFIDLWCTSEIYTHSATKCSPNYTASQCTVHCVCVCAFAKWTNKLANVRQSTQNLIDDSSHDDDSYKLIRLHNNQVNDFDWCEALAKALAKCIHSWVVISVNQSTL